MPRLITKLKFVQFLEQNPDLTAKEISEALNISISYFYTLQHKYRNEIADAAKEMSKKLALEQVHNLRRNARQKDTTAANSLLEIAKVRTKDSIFPDNNSWKITIEKIEPVKTDQK